MKKLNLIILSMVLSFGIVFFGCKKKDDPIPDPIPVCTNVISQVVEIKDDGVNPLDTTTKVYSYNAGKKLIKITYAFNSSPVSRFDTIAYNGSGEITTVKSYTIGGGSPFRTNTYYYSSGRIDSIDEVDINSPYDRMRKFTYNGSGQITAQAIVYTSGAGGGGPENISSIVYTAGNPTGALLEPGFGGPATLEYDLTAANPFRGLNNDSEEIILLSSVNNVTTVYSNLAPSSPFFTRIYTYVSGMVSIIEETEAGGDVTTTTITYACIF